MSTADSNLHALSAVLTRDVYDRFIRPQADERERTWVGRIVIVIATMAAVALVEWSQKAGAFNPLELISQLMLLAIAFSSQLLPIAIDVLFLNKGTRQGAIAGLTAGIGLVLLLTIKPEWSFGITKIVHVSALGIAANAIVFAIVSRVTQKVPQKRIDEFRRIIKAKG
jgi:SSS family solute:Na+ symporter